MKDQQVDEVIQAWNDMSGHMKTVSHHMISLVASQSATERAARSASHSVKVVVLTTLTLLVVGGFLAAVAIHSNMAAEAAHREGLRIQLSLIENQVKANQEMASECKRLVREAATISAK